MGVEYRETVGRGGIKLLLAEDNDKQTALHCAARRGEREAINKFWEWSTEKLSAEEVKELLLAEDFKEQTIVHIAAERGYTEVLNKIWEWSTEKLSAEEVRELLLAEDFKEQSFTLQH